MDGKEICLERPAPILELKTREENDHIFGETNGTFLQLPTEILEGILSNLKARDLAVCRQLSHRMNYVATPLFKKALEHYKLTFWPMNITTGIKKYRYCLLTDDSYTVDEISVDVTESKKIADYVNYLKSGETITFPNVAFKGHHILQEKNIHDLIKHFGYTLHTLKLKIPIIFAATLKRLPNLERLSITAPPHNIEIAPTAGTNENLKETKIRELTVRCRYETTGKIKWWTDLLSICPLDTFSLNIKTTQDFIEAVTALIETKRWEKITQLTITLGKNTEQRAFEKMIEHGDKMKLKVLSISHSTAGHNVVGFMATQAPSSETLRIKQLGGLPGQPVSFFLTKFLKLRTLSLELNPKNYPTGQVFQGIEINQIFPVLKNLHLLQNAKLFPVVVFFQDIQPHTNVNTLELPSYLDAEQMNNFARVCPEVEQLVVSYQRDRKVAQLIWTLWPNLKSLFICVNQSQSDRDSESTEKKAEEYMQLDGLLTGLSDEQMQQMTGLGMSLDVIPCYPSITNLIKLEKVTIHGADYKSAHGPGCFQRCDVVTDISALQAFTKMTSLRKLKVWKHKFSSAVTIMMKEAMSFESDEGVFNLACFL